MLGACKVVTRSGGFVTAWAVMFPLSLRVGGRESESPAGGRQPLKGGRVGIDLLMRSD